MFDREDVTDSTSTGSPVCGVESTKRCVLAPTHIEEDQTRTVRPVLVVKHDIVFRVPGLSHAVVKKQNISEFKSLWKRSKIILVGKHFMQTCSRRTSTKPIQQQFESDDPRIGQCRVIRVCETIPKGQCPHCLLYWNQGIVYCTCGQSLIDSESNRKFNKLRLDALSVPNYVIKKGPNHGARHGKTEEQKEYHQAWNAWKRCCKKVDSQGGQFTGIHDRFLWDPVYRESQLAIGWTEQKCKEMDEFAEENHTYHHSTEEFKRYQGQWYLTLNKAGKNGCMKLRPDFRAAVLMKIVCTTNQESMLKSLSIQNNTVDGILFKQIVVGQVWMELEVSS